MWGSKRVAEFIGVKYATLDFWIRSGLLSCDSPNDGTGNPRSWSAADVTRAAVVNELRRYGYSLQTIRGSGALDKLTDEAIANGILVCTAGNIIDIVPTFDEELEAKKKQWDSDFPITLAQFMTKHFFSRNLPPDRGGTAVVYVADIYREVSRRMKEETQEVHHEQS